MNSIYFSSLNSVAQKCLDGLCSNFLKDFAQYADKHKPKTDNTISDSAKTYKSAIKALNTDLSKVSTAPNFIIYFPEIISFLYNFGHIDSAKKVSQIAYYHILSNRLQTKTHSTGTAIKLFVKYVTSKRKKKSSSASISPVFIPIITKIENDINNYQHQYYPKSSLIQTMEIRLRRQDRTSGNKIWLPLGVITKIYNNPDRKGQKDYTFIKWINSIAKSIYIHYKNGSVIQSIKLKDVAALDIDNYAHDQVYVIPEKGGRFEALTPTGVLNKKKNMEVNHIDGIVIDHVKPIDLTLRDLGSAKLPVLESITKTMRQYPNDGLRDLSTYNDLFKNGVLTQKFKNDLKKELYAISGDSPCRLMNANLNGTKSNMTEYKYILKVGKKKEYYGIVYGDSEICKDTSSNDYVICHKLDNSLANNDIMIYTKDDYIGLKLYPRSIKITRIDINLI